MQTHTQTNTSTLLATHTQDLKTSARNWIPYLRCVSAHISQRLKPKNAEKSVRHMCWRCKKEECAHTKQSETEAKTEPRCFHAVKQSRGVDREQKPASWPKLDISELLNHQLNWLHHKLEAWGAYLALIDISHPFSCLINLGPKKTHPKPIECFQTFMTINL